MSEKDVIIELLRNEPPVYYMKKIDFQTGEITTIATRNTVKDHLLEKLYQL